MMKPKTENLQNAKKRNLLPIFKKEQSIMTFNVFSYSYSLSNSDIDTPEEMLSPSEVDKTGQCDEFDSPTMSGYSDIHTPPQETQNMVENADSIHQGTPTYAMSSSTLTPLQETSSFSMLQEDSVPNVEQLSVSSSPQLGEKESIFSLEPATDSQSDHLQDIEALGLGKTRKLTTLTMTDDHAKPPKDKILDSDKLAAANEMNDVLPRSKLDEHGKMHSMKQSKGGIHSMSDGAGESTIGWFHGKIKMENKIEWANNYQIQFLMLLLMLTALFCVTFFASSASVSLGLICGSSITIFSTSAVIYTYLNHPTWKKHPNPLIYYRSICDLCLVIVLLTTTLYKCGRKNCFLVMSGTGCYMAAGLTEFFLFASETWFFFMSTDLFRSLRSPFTDFKKNMRMYHAYVWGLSLLMAILLVSINGAAGQSEFGYCWTARGQTNNSIKDPSNALWKFNLRSWFFFYIWLFMYWIYALTVIGFAWKRLKAGLEETLRMRLRVLHSVTLYVIAIIIYWTFSFFVYVPYISKGLSECRRESGASDWCRQYQWLSEFMKFMITCKGYFDFVVWFQINELSRGDNLFRRSKVKNDFDVDVDLNPQVNLALRCEVLYYTTTGIRQAVDDASRLPPDITQHELFLQPQGVVTDDITSVEIDVYLLANPKVNKRHGTSFLDYCPHVFQSIREHFDISNEEYKQSLSRTTKERLSEGASGAFMFFSHDQKFIVKSMSHEEAIFLRAIASDYASYLLRNPDSFLTRFFGCHAIKLYGNTFYFVVMANLFTPDRVIHRRYDIKGSSVNRTAKRPSKGKKVTCRHCNGAYRYGSTNADAMNCPMRVGQHEPNMVLKDNDLTAKVRINPSGVEQIYEQISEDADFLAKLGIMDYSLLLGIENTEYAVAPLTDSTGRSVKELKSRDTNYLASNTRRTAVSTIHGLSESILSNERDGLPRLLTGMRQANRVVGPSCYYFGLIDVLQTWNFNKKLERFFKIHILRKDPDELSAIPPAAYNERFKRKMANILGIDLAE